MTTVLRELPPPAPDEGVVEMLEHLLAKARAGELQAFAMAWENTERSIGTAWGGDMDVYRLIGAMESLKRTIMEAKDA